MVNPSWRMFSPFSLAPVEARRITPVVFGSGSRGGGGAHCIERRFAEGGGGGKSITHHGFPYKKKEKKKCPSFIKYRTGKFS